MNEWILQLRQLGQCLLTFRSGRGGHGQPASASHPSFWAPRPRPPDLQAPEVVSQGAGLALLASRCRTVRGAGISLIFSASSAPLRGHQGHVKVTRFFPYYSWLKFSPVYSCLGPDFVTSLCFSLFSHCIVSLPGLRRPPTPPPQSFH